jgi:hypothetical protein
LLLELLQLRLQGKGRALSPQVRLISVRTLLSQALQTRQIVQRVFNLKVLFESSDGLGGRIQRLKMLFFCRFEQSLIGTYKNDLDSLEHFPCHHRCTQLNSF